MVQNTTPVQQNIDTGTQGDSEISILEILFRYLKYWKWFLVSVVVAMIIVFLYFRYTVPVYNVTSSVILKDVDNQKGVGGFGSLDGLEMMGSISNVENETFVMRSMTAVRSVVDRLNLHTSYMVEGRIKSSDMYTDSPFIITM